jgi:hypothetical protein
VPAHAFELPFLQDPQQAYLHIQPDGADFIEKKRALVGQFELAQLFLDGTGKGPFFVTEEFAFDQIGRNCGAVDLDKGLLGPMAVVVDGVGHQFLAGAAFPPDQDGGIAFGHLGDHLEDFPHLVAVADNVGNAVLVLQLLQEPPFSSLSVCFSRRMVSRLITWRATMVATTSAFPLF